jgi:hypothetical protein
MTIKRAITILFGMSHLMSQEERIYSCEETVVDKEELLRSQGKIVQTKNGNDNKDSLAIY